MTMRKVVLSVLLLLSAAFVGAQTQSPYTHPGKVQIRSTATDALTVAGGTRTVGLAVGTATAPSAGLVINGGTIAAEGAAISAPGGLVVNGAFASPDWTQFVFGDGTGYRLNFGTRTGGNFATRFQVYDTGSVRFANGTISAPSMTFINEPTSGFYWDSGASGGFNVAVGSAKAARFSQAGLEVPAEARGTGGVAGKILTLGRNTSGSGAPGQLVLEARNGAGSGFIWVDTTGVVRVGTSAATEVGGDTGGTVIGTQTSTRASKHILGQVNHLAPSAMDLVRKTPIWAFTYKSGSFNGETFYGVTTDDSPLFGMDAGKSFNPVNAFGATVLALQDVDRRVQDLEARLAVALATIETLKKREP